MLAASTLLGGVYYPTTVIPSWLASASEFVPLGYGLRALRQGRTTFVIAHRLATVVNADRIIVLKEGRIDEQGTHAELMRRNGYYASLVRQQTKGLIQNVGEPLDL